MESASPPQGAHLVGSVPYTTAEEVFTTVSKALPGRLCRIPDGEPGARWYWTLWVHYIFPDWALTAISYPAKLAKERGDPEVSLLHWFGNPQQGPERQPGDKMVVKPTDYAKEAVNSYAIFKKLKQGGVIEPGVRFQVSIPTSVSIVASHIQPRYRSEADAILEPLLLEDVKRIQEAIPASELAIQFDCACEMGLLEYEAGRSPEAWFKWFPEGTEVMPELIPRMRRYSAAVDEGVELGFHFCYGDIGHQHWAQPLDTGRVVNFFNEIRKVVSRPIDFVHLPVPVDRDDDEYFKPLTEMNVDPKTELYLGLVREDDLDGTRKRLATAQKIVTRRFGIATECGLGRTDAAATASVLKIIGEVAGPVSKPRLSSASCPMND